MASSSSPSGSSASLLSWRGHSGLVIENNTVDGWQQGIAAVSIAGARNVSVRGNVLRASAMTLGQHMGWRAADKITAARTEEARAQWGAAIQVDNATRVTIEANDIFGPFPHNMTAGAVRIGSGADNVKVSSSNSVTPSEYTSDFLI